MSTRSGIHNPFILYSIRCFIAFLVVFFGYADLFGDEPAVIKRWEFHSADDMAGWQNPHDLKDVSVTNHRLRMTITGPDAYIFAPGEELGIYNGGGGFCGRST